jgi:hypothetical protein
MYKIRLYTKTNGSVGYELYDTATGEVISRDDSYAKIHAIKCGMEQEAA